MEDSDSATLELTQGEAREAINALAEHEARATGAHEERTHNVKDILKREFDFEGDPFSDQQDIVERIAEIFAGDTGTHEVELTRSEAAEVHAALADVHPDPDSADADTVADLRDRLEETFDLSRTA